jgi:hypothetical protein
MPPTSNLSVTLQKIHIDEIMVPIKLRILQNLLSEQQCLVTNSCYERLKLEHKVYCHAFSLGNATTITWVLRI